MSPRAVGKKKASTRAEGLLSRHSIRTPPVPVEEIAEQQGLAVLYEQLPPETSSVLIRAPDGRRVIGVNAHHAPRRQRFSLAHELGHALLHFPDAAPTDGEAVVDRPLEILFRDGVAGQGTNRMEVDANTFAAALLMPEALVMERFRQRLQRDRTRHIDTIVDDLADEFDVSSQAMRYRLINLGLADPA